MMPMPTATGWLLVNATGRIEAQSGGFEVKLAYVLIRCRRVPPSPRWRHRQRLHRCPTAFDDDGIVAGIALQNQVDQNTNANMNGLAASTDMNPVLQ